MYALGVMAAGIIWPDVWLEYLVYVYSIPVVVVCGWEWLEKPEFMEKIFGKGKDKGRGDEFEI